MDVSSSFAITASSREADVFTAAAAFLPSLPADRELLLSFCWVLIESLLPGDPFVTLPLGFGPATFFALASL
jgi:hypothetical protein